jgi:hypothetical protein
MIGCGAEPQQERYLAPFDSGFRIKGVFIGSEDCVYCDTVVHNRVNDVFATLHDVSTACGVDFLALGVSIDTDLQKGIRYLQKNVPTINEIMVGNSWLNEGSRKYLFERHRTIASTPQIILMIEYYDVLFQPMSVVDFHVTDSILFRFSGYPDITERMSIDVVKQQFRSVLNCR